MKLLGFTKRLFYILLLVVMTVFSGLGGRVFADLACGSLSTEDCDSLYGNWAGWVPDNASSSCGTTDDDSTTTQAASTGTVAQQIASTFIIGINAADPKTAQAIATDLATKYHIGGTFLVGTKDAAAAGFNKAFYASLGTAAGSPLVASSDEEGVVTRYNYGNVSFPAASTMAKQSDSAVEAIGKNAGKVMSDNGLNADLAPVLDLRDVGTGLTGRSFSSDPSVVADKAGAFAAGLEESGIAPIFKHFPGFDDTTTGSTDDQRVVMKGSIDQTIAPYKTLLAKYPNAGVMLSNMYVNKIDANNPSSLSTATVKYLRSTLGFKGLITTDDLSVSSITGAAGSLANAVSQSLQAGVTMPLFTLGGSSVEGAENNLATILGAVQNNSAAMTAITGNAAIIKSFKGAGSATATTAASGSCCGTGATTLTGSDNATKTWNYFKSQGLDDTHVAAIMGNLQQESSFNPEIIQGGGTTDDPSTVTDSSTGWGIAQWTPGSKIIGIAKSFNITTPIYELATELSIVWAEMNTGPTPTGNSDFMKGFNATTTLADATQYFTSNFEGPSVVGPRLTDAQGALARYGGAGGGSSSGSSTTTSTSCGVSPDCASASGAAKILCAAKVYDSVSYSASETGGHQGGAQFHKDCPTVGDTDGCQLDCSGLVNIAVYDAFGVDLRESTSTEVTDTKNWQKIPFSKLQPGDLVQPNSGHVEIVDHIVGNKIYAFAAHTQTVPQPQQVGEWDDSPDNAQTAYIFLHYIGQGS